MFTRLCMPSLSLCAVSAVPFSLKYNVSHDGGSFIKRIVFTLLLNRDSDPAFLPRVWRVASHMLCRYQGLGTNLVRLSTLPRSVLTGFLYEHASDRAVVLLCCHGQKTIEIPYPTPDNPAVSNSSYTLNSEFYPVEQEGTQCALAIYARNCVCAFEVAAAC